MKSIKKSIKKKDAVFIALAAHQQELESMAARMSALNAVLATLRAKVEALQKQATSADVTTKELRTRLESQSSFNYKLANVLFVQGLSTREGMPTDCISSITKRLDARKGSKS